MSTVDLLLRSGAVPEPTFLWWDVRPQPRFGTVEVRIMDAQPRLEATAALCALVQALARLELEEGYPPHELAQPSRQTLAVAGGEVPWCSLTDGALTARLPVATQGTSTGSREALVSCWPSARASLRGALPVCAGTEEDDQ